MISYDDFGDYLVAIANYIPPDDEPNFVAYLKEKSPDFMALKKMQDLHISPWLVSGAFTDDIYPSLPTYNT